MIFLKEENFPKTSKFRNCVVQKKDNGKVRGVGIEYS